MLASKLLIVSCARLKDARVEAAGNPRREAEKDARVEGAKLEEPKSWKKLKARSRKSEVLKREVGRTKLEEDCSKLGGRMDVHLNCGIRG